MSCDPVLMRVHDLLRSVSGTVWEVGAGEDASQLSKFFHGTPLYPLGSIVGSVYNLIDFFQ